jgi:hypothetical protein
MKQGVGQRRGSGTSQGGAGPSSRPASSFRSPVGPSHHLRQSASGEAASAEQELEAQRTALAVGGGAPLGAGAAEDDGLAEFSRMLSVFAHCGKLKVRSCSSACARHFPCSKVGQRVPPRQCRGSVSADDGGRESPCEK